MGQKNREIKWKIYLMYYFDKLFNIKFHVIHYSVHGIAVDTSFNFHIKQQLAYFYVFSLLFIQLYMQFLIRHNSLLGVIININSVGI